jgi:hypothetical protein
LVSPPPPPKHLLENCLAVDVGPFLADTDSRRHRECSSLRQFENKAKAISHMLCKKSYKRRIGSVADPVSF